MGDLPNVFDLLNSIFSIIIRVKLNNEYMYDNKMRNM